MPKSPKPIRLTRRRADALLKVFEFGAATQEEGMKLQLRINKNPTLDEMRALRDADHDLAAARDAAAIIAARYAGGSTPTTTTPPLFD